MSQEQINKALEVAPWLKDAVFENASIIVQNDMVIWKSGTWKGGTWEKGTWENGIWENGIWENGTWEKGIWKNGVSSDKQHMSKVSK